MSSVSLYPYPTLAPGDATGLDSDGYSIVVAPPVVLSPQRRSVLSRRMRLLVLGTIAFNTTEVAVAVADSRQTRLCTYLSGALLIGLLLEIVTG